jgi:hypothetical protein
LTITEGTKEPIAMVGQRVTVTSDSLCGEPVA